MTFVLDAIRLEVLEGYTKVQETTLIIHLSNTTGRDITISRVCTTPGKIVSFPPVAIYQGSTLTINADATHFGWRDGESIHWWIEYSVDDPVFYIEKI